MKAKEIHELSENEVEKKLRDTRDEHVKMRMSKQTGQVEETQAQKFKKRYRSFRNYFKGEKTSEHFCLNLKIKKNGNCLKT